MQGKTSFYVAKQSDIEDVPVDKLAELEDQVKQFNEENKALSEEVKRLTSGEGKRRDGHFN